MKALKIFVAGILLCIAVYIGFFIGRSTLSGTISLSKSAPIDTSREIQVINLNTATADQLRTLPGVGPQMASAIIEYRKKYGDYVYVNELLDVAGMSKELFDSIKQYVTVD